MLITNTLLNDCWQAGVDCVLAGEGDEAQAIWLSPFLDDELSIEEEQLSQSLIDYLSGAVELQLSAGELQAAHTISKCLCAVAPDNVNALLRLLDLSISAQEFTPEILADHSFVEIFAQALPGDIDADLCCQLMRNMEKTLAGQDADAYMNFLALLVDKIDIRKFICVVAPQSFALSQKPGLNSIRQRMLELCFEHAPTDLKFIVLCDLVRSSLQDAEYDQAIELGKQCREAGEKIGAAQHICGSQQLLSALMNAGEWQQISAVAEQHQQLVHDFVDNYQGPVADTATIIATTYFLSYLDDYPRTVQYLRAGIGDICAASISLAPKNTVFNEHYQAPVKTKALRIGYIASTLGTHSVGWLSRWLFHYHDRSEFELFIYHVGHEDLDPFNRKYFRDKVDVAHYLGGGAEEIADLIRRDQIDILIDLDSISLSLTYQVMCRKPAPVTVTWLGADVSGCPGIDYFIADPYVLPSDAEEYYRTKIWRLPQTYVAIDGFEIQVPTKRRSDYQLPADAIVYLCTQKSYKHHPDILRLQMQIIKQVPNSYLLVKLRANPESLMRIYQDLAEEVGISMEQLRFIQPDRDELTHRANLQLADVVLDTFPYNGATTTLETLWMGVPMVTKVGQAFAARNSYAFMINAGITEGIAHTDEEYVEWGVKLGLSLDLRQQVMGKLLQSRKTSPLWNSRSFTLEMEKAYRQMWEIYQSKSWNVGVLTPTPPIEGTERLPSNSPT
jgi:predicted O-linked N-acetylglucosamine transferase (SPINDLY family)